MELIVLLITLTTLWNQFLYFQWIHKENNLDATALVNTKLYRW